MNGPAQLEYDAERCCPKCGHDVVSTYYSSGRWSCGYGDRFMHPDTEHLDRTCQRCHYRWPERCPESAPNPSASLKEQP
jgi:ribosomal protein S27AE